MAMGARVFIWLTAVLGLFLQAGLAAAETSRLPAWGAPGVVWKGTSRAIGGDYSWVFNLEFLPDGNARIEYPQYACGGTLAYETRDGDQAEFSETIDFDIKSVGCKPSGRVVVSENADKSLDLKFFASGSDTPSSLGKTAVASGAEGNSGRDMIARSEAYLGSVRFQDGFTMTLAMEFISPLEGLLYLRINRSPSCDGKLAFVREADGVVEYSLDADRERNTSGSSSRCVGDASVFINSGGSSAEGPVTVQLVAGSEMSASGELRSLAAERREIRKKAVARDPCRSAVWEGVVPNIYDLFLCDQGRTIMELTQGRDIMFTVGDVSLQDGFLYSSMTTKSTYGQKSEDQSASQLFKVTCAFDIEKRPDLSRGDTIAVHATITQSDNGAVLLHCER